ncbi:MAG: DUF29 domain-containing protein [Deltaproteobacteria bacterium]|nr:DUF29 domain-containing protein [Deltaproteobacteria bacterium]
MDLYEKDYYAWITNQVRAMRERRVKDIDWDNVAEEIEDLGKSEKHSVESQLARICEHFLKLAYAPARLESLNRRRWELSIREARHQLRKLLSESPSLRGKTAEILADAYETGRTATLIALNLPDSAVPETPSWTLEQLLDDSFLPDRTNSRHGRK